MQKPNSLYHLCTSEQWQACQSQTSYVPEAFREEGFIHCSHLHQLVVVADRRFRYSRNLLLLIINPDGISSEIIEENLDGGVELFPHIYGELPHTSVKQIAPFPCMQDGFFKLPGEIL